jgi:hypothetical protein
MLPTCVLHTTQCDHSHDDAQPCIRKYDSYVCRNLNSTAVVVDCVEGFTELCLNLFMSAQRIGLRGMVAMTTSEALCRTLEGNSSTQGNFCVDQTEPFSIVKQHVESGDHCAGGRRNKGYYRRIHGYLAELMVRACMPCFSWHVRKQSIACTCLCKIVCFFVGAYAACESQKRLISGCIHSCVC